MWDNHRRWSPPQGTTPINKLRFDASGLYRSENSAHSEGTFNGNENSKGGIAELYYCPSSPSPVPLHHQFFPASEAVRRALAHDLAWSANSGSPYVKTFPADSSADLSRTRRIDCTDCDDLGRLCRVWRPSQPPPPPRVLNRLSTLKAQESNSIHVKREGEASVRLKHLEQKVAEARCVKAEKLRSSPIGSSIASAGSGGAPSLGVESHPPQPSSAAPHSVAAASDPIMLSRSPPPGQLLPRGLNGIDGVLKRARAAQGLYMQLQDRRLKRESRERQKELQKALDQQREGQRMRRLAEYQEELVRVFGPSMKHIIEDSFFDDGTDPVLALFRSQHGVPLDDGDQQQRLDKQLASMTEEERQKALAAAWREARITHARRDPLQRDALAPRDYEQLLQVGSLHESSQEYARGTLSRQREELKRALDRQRGGRRQAY